LASVLDPDLFLHFEITPHRTVLFYLTLFGSILAVARGMVPDEHRVFDPHELMSDVIHDTHYMPDSWQDALHSKRVHSEFGELFVMKILIYAQEVLSVVMTPFVLWFSLPGCAPEIVDFFREFTVHVDGLGYVCSFALFDFQRHGNVKFGAATKVEERLTSKEGKMEKSFLNFKAAHPEWNPSDPSGSMYLSRMADYRSTTLTPHRRRQSQDHSTVDQADKTREYETALAQSQAIARRRRQPGTGAGMATSTMVNQVPGDEGSTLFTSAIGLGMAKTAVLGDSSMNVALNAGSPGIVSAGGPPAKPIALEDRTPDEGVGSGLGESYVDGGRARVEGPSVTVSQVEEDDGLEDGGVLGLLAQIYGTRARGQGPARAIS
jgi:autophagy-related protein 9